MSTNISKEKREALVAKIQSIKKYIATAPQDENTAQLLTYIAEIEKDIKGKKYGLVFEEHREAIDDILDNNTPVLVEDESLFIENGGQMNFLIEGDNLASLQLLEKTHKLYSFVINNFDLLRRTFREAMAKQLEQISMSIDLVSEKTFFIPQSALFTYDSQSKVQIESEKNVYQGYLLSAEPRSSSERRFEKFCESCSVVDWIYKNGDKGDEYFSIVYLDNGNHQKLFYPDYIVSVHGETWIIETKGGFTKSGDSEDIDIFSAKKFDVLKSYLKKRGLKGGFVRYDKQSEELCICTENYNDDIHSDSWALLGDIIK